MICVVGVELADEADLLAGQIVAAAELGDHVPSTQQEGGGVPGRFEVELAVSGGEGSNHRHGDLGGGEASVADGLANALGIEGLAFGGPYGGGSGFKIDFDTTDAIQASQGLFGPIGSQRSRHAVDAQMGLLYLRESGGAGEEPGN